MNPNTNYRFEENFQVVKNIDKGTASKRTNNPALQTEGDEKNCR